MQTDTSGEATGAGQGRGAAVNTWDMMRFLRSAVESVRPGGRPAVGAVRRSSPIYHLGARGVNSDGGANGVSRSALPPRTRTCAPGRGGPGGAGRTCRAGGVAAGTPAGRPGA